MISLLIGTIVSIYVIDRVFMKNHYHFIYYDQNFEILKFSLGIFNKFLLF